MRKYDYVEVNGYQLPALTVPEDSYNIGKYGMLHRTFLKENYQGLYADLKMRGRLLRYLSEVDSAAQSRVDELIMDLAERQGITERLKADEPMKWVGLMNNIKHQAEEIIYNDIVYNKDLPLLKSHR